MNRLRHCSFSRKKGFIGSLLLSGLLLAEAGAAVAITLSSSPPSDNVFLSIAPEGTGDRALNGYDSTIASGVRELGQTFQAPGTDPVALQSFTLQLTTSVKTGAPGASMTVSIFSIAGPTAQPAGTPLYQQSGILPNNLPLQSYLTFSLDTPLSLDGGSYYAIQVGFTNIAANQGFNLVTGTSYANGTAFYYANSPNPGTMVYSNQSFDLKMSLQTIPESGTIAFLCIGLGLVAMRLHRKRPIDV